MSLHLDGERTGQAPIARRRADYGTPSTASDLPTLGNHIPDRKIVAGYFKVHRCRRAGVQSHTIEAFE